MLELLGTNGELEDHTKVLSSSDVGKEVYSLSDMPRATQEGAQELGARQHGGVGGAYPWWFYVVHSYFALLWIAGVIIGVSGIVLFPRLISDAFGSPLDPETHTFALLGGSFLGLWVVGLAVNVTYVLAICPATTVQVTGRGLQVRSVLWRRAIGWENLVGYVPNILLLRTLYGGFPIPALATLIIWDKRQVGGSGRAVLYSLHRDYKEILAHLGRRAKPLRGVARF